MPVDGIPICVVACIVYMMKAWGSVVQCQMQGKGGGTTSLNTQVSWYEADFVGKSMA
jgi:hypothetical protein